MSTSEEGMVFKIKVLESIERFEDMRQVVKEVALKVAKEGRDLNADQRNLLSVSYKQPVGLRRSACRGLDPPTDRNLRADKLDRPREDFRNALRKEILEISEDVVQLLETTLIKPNRQPDSLVFYNKMLGDYCRYIAEFSEGDEKAAAASKSNDAYETATKIANAELPPTHPIRLGLALNYSVFFYEIRNDPEAACKLAKTAFDDAISELDQLSEDSYKDSTLIMQLLRDNLTLWTADTEGEDEAKKSPEEKA